MEAAKHPFQDKRIAALQSYNILDTEREADFDEVVELAAAICETAISVVNFIDEDRQWFKAEVGLGVRETPLATSICSHVILEEDFVEIEDTLSDPRMVDNPLCCGDPGLRFYAGALLKTEDGLPLGTLCVLDWQPRQLTDLQRRAIKVLAAQVVAQLNLRRALREADLLSREVDHRVKNSLNSIGALARVAARNASDASAKDAILAMGHRIASVAQVHEMLYKTGAGNVIRLDTYVDNLISEVREIAPDTIELMSHIAPVDVNSRQAGSLGLLVNEFVTNSLKHAFPGEAAGRVKIEGQPLDDGRYQLTLSDNGVGLGPAADLDGAGMGMVVLKVVCSQLDCETDVQSSENGLRMTLQFNPQPDMPG